MRLYVSSHGLTNPSLMRTLELITTFIVGVYYPCLYEIKAKHKWLDGPRHVLHQLQLLQLPDSTVQELVNPYVKSSCWYAHSEMILQTMISSEDAEEWRFAVETITKIRGSANKGSTVVRFRRHPDQNPQAATLEELVSWEDAHEPVLTTGISTNELQLFLSKPMQLPSFPVNGQSIERCVKEVTAAAQQVVGT